MKPSESRVWQAIPGWCTNIEGDYLYQVAAGLPENAIIVDIGTYFGRSACAFALGCLESGARVITIDHFRGNPENVQKPAYMYVTDQIGRMGKDVKDRVKIIPVEAIEFGERFPKKAHVVYIDNEHGFNTVVNTFSAWYRNVIKGGHILFHDSFNTGWNEVVEAINYISENWPMEDAGHADSIRHFRKPAG